MFNNITERLQSQAVFKVLQELQDRKQEHEQLAPYLIKAFKECHFHTDEKEDRVKNCASYIAITPQGKISGANFCKNRYCPICQWRLSRKTYGQMSKIQKDVEDTNPDMDFIFLTLTLRNMENLNEGISEILKAFNNFLHDRSVKKINKGFVRALEVTWSKKHQNWHPHIHTIIAVDKGYFKSKDYKRLAEWCLLWKRAARLNYTPQVNVKKIYGNREKAIAEIAKYTVKPIDLTRVKIPLEKVFGQLLNSTHNRRLRSFGGQYRKSAAKLNALKEPELTDAVLSPEDTEFKFSEGQYKEIQCIACDENGEIVARKGVVA